MNCRGFLIGCTAGRTTLNGEGLQHQDGHSLILAATNPGVISYEPTFAYEAATIVQDGLRRMLSGDDVIYYLTAQNEPYAMPAIGASAAGEETAEGVRRGCYLLRTAAQLDGVKLKKKAPAVQLLGSGSIMAAVLEAQEELAKEHGVRADVWSVTSYSELRREALAAELSRRQGDKASSWLEETLCKSEGPVVAASDWMTLVPDQLSRWLGTRLTSLGTDGFGMSDTRQALRKHFGVDKDSIVQATLFELGQ